MGTDVLEKVHQERFEEPEAADAEAKRLAQLIILTQKKDLVSQTALHVESTEALQPAVLVSPPSAFRFTQTTLQAEFQAFLLEVRKSGRVFWVGAVVPKGTKDFTRAQMYFHPTAKLADDRDYREFKGGWAEIRANFIKLIGVQAAAAERPAPLLLPFTKKSALQGNRRGGLSDDNLFKDRPVQTLNAIMGALHRLVTGKSAAVRLAKLGVASFSDGIKPMRIALSALQPSGIVKEVFDFDSPFIVNEPKSLTFTPGAVAKCFSQEAPQNPMVGYVQLQQEHFSGVTATFGRTKPRDITHQRIGKMMYFQALKNSFV